MHHYSQEFVYVDMLSQESLREHQVLLQVYLGFHLLKQSRVWSDIAFGRTSRPALYRSHILTSQLEELPDLGRPPFTKSVPHHQVFTVLSGTRQSVTERIWVHPLRKCTVIVRASWGFFCFWQWVPNRTLAWPEDFTLKMNGFLLRVFKMSW